MGAWREVKLVLRFLACLQGLLEGEGVFPILEDLFSRAVDLQTASSEDVSTTESVIIIFNTNTAGAGARFRASQDHPSYHRLRYELFSNWI